jgi:hypothetical protein
MEWISFTVGFVLGHISMVGIGLWYFNYKMKNTFNPMNLK